MDKKIEFRSKHFNELNISELYEIAKLDMKFLLVNKK